MLQICYNCYKQVLPQLFSFTVVSNTVICLLRIAIAGAYGIEGCPPDITTNLVVHHQAFMYSSSGFLSEFLFALFGI